MSLIWVSVAVGKDIGDTCSSAKPRVAGDFPKLTKPSDLGKSHRHLKDHRHPEVRAMYKGLDSFAKSLETIQEESWRENKQVRSYLETISQRLNNTFHESLPKAPQNKLAKKMYQLVQRFPTAQSRLDKGDEYYKELEQALALTETGLKVLKCYNSDARHPMLVKGPMGRLIVGSELSSSEKMSLDMVPATAAGETQKLYATYLRFDFNEDPVGALLGLAHELSHGCDFSQKMPELTVAAHQVRRVGQEFRQQMAEYVMAQKMMEHIEEKKKSMGSALAGKFARGQEEGARSPSSVEEKGFKDGMAATQAKMEEMAKEYLLARREYDQLRAISELRAYKQTALLARELAEAYPDLVCQTHTVSLMYGPRVATWAEIQTELEDQLRRGTFFDFMVADYVASKHYERDSFYEMKEGKVVEPAHFQKNFMQRLTGHPMPDVKFSSKSNSQ
ncbi:MAG: hypothetical protein H6624_11260 [Bdellovibrionaceae bacterium]|nr:hypothetical protein [Bdellovibrionales bacterium]MCB9084916.1 hypothetical protein [Pseudobdellovibrionaceae bacterium]